MPTLEIIVTHLWLVSQTADVAEVERQLSVVEELAAVVPANSLKSRGSVLQRATRLRQSLFQKTFTDIRY